MRNSINPSAVALLDFRLSVLKLLKLSYVETPS